jgi:hypothetical protein
MASLNFRQARLLFFPGAGKLQSGGAQKRIPEEVRRTNVKRKNKNKNI